METDLDIIEKNLDKDVINKMRKDYMKKKAIQLAEL